MRTVYHYVVPVDDHAHRIGLTGPIVHVASRYETAVEFWAIADVNAEETLHWFQVIGTGHAMPEPSKGVVGSAVTPSGQLVWHLIELGGAS